MYYSKYLLKSKILLLFIVHFKVYYISYLFFTHVYLLFFIILSCPSKVISRSSCVTDVTQFLSRLKIFMIMHQMGISMELVVATLVLPHLGCRIWMMDYHAIVQLTAPLVNNLLCGLRSITCTPQTYDQCLLPAKMSFLISTFPLVYVPLKAFLRSRRYII